MLKKPYLRVFQHIMKFRFAPCLLLLLFLPWLQEAAGNSLDESFLAAHEATGKGDLAQTDRLAGELRAHELAAYVDYWRIQLDLKKTPDTAAIMAFLAANEGDYLAEKVRGDWLREVGRQQQWAVFDAHYPALRQPDQELVCYALHSRIARGDEGALDEAMTLWRHLIEPPESCHPVLEALIIGKRVGVDDVWARVRRQVESNRLTGARHSMNYLPPSQTPDARTARAVTDTPLPWLTRTQFSDSRRHRELVALAIARVARNDPYLAVEQMERLESRLKDDERAWAWSQIAWQAALRHMDEAPIWYAKAGEIPMSDTLAQWRIRAALRAEDWDGVRAAIEKLPPALADSPVWTYWLARAYRAGGRLEEARALFWRIAGQPNFYSHLADEELGRGIAPPPRAMPPTDAEMTWAASLGAVRRSLALLRLGLRIEGVREWNWAMRGMSDRELLAAATVAERAGVHDRAIFSAERTLEQHDYVLRYPLPFSEPIRSVAHGHSLDEALVYGLIRQESRFIVKAHSSAGASGLMQLMPATARWLAKRIGMKDFHPSRVQDIKTNALLGISYLSLLLENFDRRFVPAVAAYNAGPKRAHKWQLGRPRESAIYIETIPFDETRDYIKKVMSNTIYYSALLTGQPQSVKYWLTAIGPGTTETKAEELP
jgi:soluble lytic murein transglycosylase